MTCKYKHLTLDARQEIQKGLKDGKTFTEIGEIVGKDPSTISKEVRAHLITEQTGTRSRSFNPCKKRNTCTHERDVCESCFNAFSFRNTYCSTCGMCTIKCDEFEEEICQKLKKPPYVCNGCKQIRSCTLEKKKYDAKKAQKDYEELRSESREGIDLTPEELRRIDDVVSPLVKQGQSIHQICVNNADEIMVDERSIYNYIDAGILTVGNLDLPRKVRYRKRKQKKVVHVDKKCHLGRTYEDFLAFMEAHPDYAVVEMDSVEGTRDSTKVLLTIYFRDSSLMLAFLREANTARSVTGVFDELDEMLGREQFKKLFPVILTDRGSEFTDPASIEFDKEGKRRTYIFYCDPQRSNQKGGIEVTHEFIRRILPKGTSFKYLKQEQVELMMNHINSYARKKLNDRSANQLFSFFHGDEVATKLGIKAIPSNEIILKPELLNQ